MVLPRATHRTGEHQCWSQDSGIRKCNITKKLSDTLRKGSGVSLCVMSQAGGKGAVSQVGGGREKGSTLEAGWGCPVLAGVGAERTPEWVTYEKRAHAPV